VFLCNYIQLWGLGVSCRTSGVVPIVASIVAVLALVLVLVLVLVAVLVLVLVAAIAVLGFIAALLLAALVLGFIKLVLSLSANGAPNDRNSGLDQSSFLAPRLVP